MILIICITDDDVYPILSIFLFTSVIRNYQQKNRYKNDFTLSLSFLLNYIIFIKSIIQTLNQINQSILSQNSSIRPSTLPTSHSTYFLKGTNPRQLTEHQQSQIVNFIAKDPYNTSLFIYDPSQTQRKMRSWQNLLSWIQPHFAIKSCPSIELVQDLASYGTGMDCASKPQIQLALNSGITLNNIVYSNSVKNEKDLIWAQSVGIKLTTADTFQQLFKIIQHAPSIGILWRIAIKQEATDQLSSTFSGKFGDDLQNQQQIHHRMKQIADLGVNLQGIHFHCGSGMHGSSAFGKAVKLARKCIEIGRMYGHQMHTLDIGGGFPAGDLPQSTVDALKPTFNDPLNYRVIAQPGRYLSSRCFFLATRIIGVRTKSGKTCLHLNDSVYHTFNCILMDNVNFDNSEQFYSKIQNGKITEISDYRNSTVYGMTCDGLDIISKNLATPVQAKIGDWFCFGGMGSYTFGVKTAFNGMTATDQIYRLEQSDQMAIQQPSQEQLSIIYPAIPVEH